MKSFFNETLNFFFRKVLGLLSFGPCPSCMSSANIVVEIQFKLLNERSFEHWRTMYLGICQFAPVIHRSTLSIHWYIAQNVQPTFYMSAFFRRSSKTAMLSRFLKVAMAMSNFMNEVYNGRFLPEFSILMLKEIITLV